MIICLTKPRDERGQDAIVSGEEVKNKPSSSHAGKDTVWVGFLSSDLRCWINQRVNPDFQNIPMDGVSADGVGQLGEDRGEGKANDREEQGGGETLDQAGPQGEPAMESKDKQGKSHGSDQGGGREQLPQQQVVDAPKDQHAANLSGWTWFAETI